MFCTQEDVDAGVRAEDVDEAVGLADLRVHLLACGGALHATGVEAHLPAEILGNLVGGGGGLRAEGVFAAGVLAHLRDP